MKRIIRVVAFMAVVAALLPSVPPRTQPAAAQVISFTAGELLGRLTASSATVNVVPSQSVDIRAQYGTSPGAYFGMTGEVSVSGGQGGEVTISGLSANTRYYYRIEYDTGDGTWESRDEHTFHTQRSAGSGFTFVMQSDSHIQAGPATSAQTYNNAIDNMVADAPDFLIDLGDMFAVTGSNAAVRNSYISQRGWLEPISANAGVYLGIGNHENEEGWFRSGPTPNLPIYSANARKELFVNPVPDSFYSGDSQSYSGLGVNGDGLRETYYSWEWGDALFVVLDPFWNTTSRPHSVGAGADPVNTPVSNDRWDWTLGLAQYVWLRQTLATSTKPFKFVMTHHLVGGATSYGRGGVAAVAAGFEWGEDNSALFGAERDFDSGWIYGSIHEILVDNNVNAVFHGHDHCYAMEELDDIIYQEVPMPNAASSADANFCGGGYAAQLDNSGHIRVDVTSSVALVTYVRSDEAVNGEEHDQYGLDAAGGTINLPPSADAGDDITVTDTDGNGSQGVAMDGTGSGDPDGSIDVYRWFDGFVLLATGVSPTIDFEVGSREVTLEVEDDEGTIDSDTVTVTVNSPPTADAGPDQDLLDANDNGLEPVDFDGSASSDAEGSIVAYSWSEDGSEIATGMRPTNVLLGLGTHEITLEVTDDDGAAHTDTITVKVNSPPVMPEPGGGSVTVQARYGNDVAVEGFEAGTGNVTVAFTDPGAGPTCGSFKTQNGGGNPGCDLHPGWTTKATGNGGPAEVAIHDITIVGFDTTAETVEVSVDHADGELDFGCDGTVAIAYEFDVDDGASAIRMVAGPEATIDFSEPGPCAGLFDDATVDLEYGRLVYVTAWDSDGDRTLEVREIQDPFECPTATTPFIDVPPTSFAYDDIKCIYGLGLTTGTSDTTYSPGAYVTREQMAAFLARLARLLGVDIPGATHPFVDVSPTSFAYDDIALIRALGVTTGTTDTTYSPGAYVTREQMAAFIARLFSVLLGTPSVPVLALTQDTPFTDVPTASFAYDDVGRIYGLDITTGTSPATYGPAEYVTREQLASFLARLLRILLFA